MGKHTVKKTKRSSKHATSKLKPSIPLIAPKTTKDDKKRRSRASDPLPRPSRTLVSPHKKKKRASLPLPGPAIAAAPKRDKKHSRKRRDLAEQDEDNVEMKSDQLTTEEAESSSVNGEQDEASSGDERDSNSSDNEDTGSSASPSSSSTSSTPDSDSSASSSSGDETDVDPEPIKVDLKENTALRSLLKKLRRSSLKTLHHEDSKSAEDEFNACLARSKEIFVGFLGSQMVQGLQKCVKELEQRTAQSVNAIQREKAHLDGPDAVKRQVNIAKALDKLDLVNQQLVQAREAVKRDVQAIQKDHVQSLDELEQGFVDECANLHAEIKDGGAFKKGKRKSGA